MMFVYLFIFLQLANLVFSSGQKMDPASDLLNQTVVNGSSVILPCSAPNRKIDAVVWYRVDKDSQQKLGKYIFMYRDNNESKTNQDPAYQGRADLRDRRMKDGDVSLLLKWVTHNDSGQYKCEVFTEGVNEPISECAPNLTVENSDGRNTTTGDIYRIYNILTAVSYYIITFMIVIVYIKCRPKKKPKEENNNLSPV